MKKLFIKLLLKLIAWWEGLSIKIESLPKEEKKGGQTSTEDNFHKQGESNF